MIRRIASKSDILGVTALQSKYLYDNLTEDQRFEGFVTTPFTKVQLEEVIELEGLFIAEDNSEIVGYAFAGSWDYFKQ
ncbi:MAG: GNAT family acetyltransferase, partial [Bacteroidota bacterium]